VTAAQSRVVTSAALIALIFVCLAWELWLAPLRPGGSWLTLKAVVLLAPLFGILRGNRYTYKWTSLLVQIYLLEGLLRATSDTGLSQWLAVAETALATLVFAGVILYLRATRSAATGP
jgi:uncharacterized membrane protein